MPAELLGDIQGEFDSDLAAALRDCLRFGALVIDVGQGTATFTGQAARILGLELLAGPCCSVAALPAPIRQVLGEIVSARSPPAQRQIELERPGAGTVKVRWEALQLEPGAPNSPVVILIHEAGPAAELQRKLCQFERLANLGTLSASVAHEIRNALVAVRTFTDLLIEKDPQTEMALLVQREIQRIDSIVGRMLKFSGPARPAASTVSLHEALEHCLRLVQPQLKAKSIGVVRRFEASADRVQGDDAELQQAFLNLFLNAKDAMSPGGTLTVGTRSLAPAAAPGLTLHDQGSPRIGITIQDTGMGIAPEDLARIFEPFFTSKPDGTGLGLSITRRIIHAHHGEISVQSQPGQGTVVNIALPAAA